MNRLGINVGSSIPIFISHTSSVVVLAGMVVISPGDVVLVDPTVVVGSGVVIGTVN